MEILVCIKEVPDDSVQIKLNTETQQPELSDVTPVVNAFDTYALEMATRLKEAVEGTVTVVSIGNEDVKNSLKNCLAVGADEAYLVKEDGVKEYDSLKIAKKLAEAVKKIEAERGKEFDVIFCGKETTDHATSQVPLMLADELNLGVMTNIIDIETSEDSISAKQEMDEGFRIFEGKLPVIVSVNKPNYDPRYPTIKSKMQARKKSIAEISVDSDSDNLIKVVKVYEPAKRAAGVKINEEAVEDTVAKAIEVMTEAKIF